MVESLWGADFNIVEEESSLTKKILEKVKKPKKVKEVSTDKIIKSDSVSLDEKMELISEDVKHILGQYTDDTIVIRDLETFKNYIDAAVKNNVIAVDTETNNSLDPLTCKIMGLCLYTPGQKNAYVPVNHINPYTNEKLSNQLTEEEIGHELERLKSINCIFHNGKFDYMVIYYTCGVKLPITWDTMIGSQLLNENEPAGLKFQYKDKIKPDQDKYDIEHLFKGLDYAIFRPDLFALYAATDAFMTYQLYEYQLGQFTQVGNERLYKLFREIEMPVVTVTAEMEMRGLGLDLELADRLSKKFHKRLEETDRLIDIEMENYRPLIEQWRVTPEANYSPVKGGKKQKSLNEKLSDPVELTSSTQLGIFFYDVLKILKSRDGKKKVDEESLLKLDIPLAKLILQKREYEKYLGTYIDKLPLVRNEKDNRIHAHFNQMGREDKNVVTGRMSSSDPNLQNIPARGDIVTVRCMFVPTTNYNEVDKVNNVYTIPIEDEVLLNTGEYKWSSELVEGDILDTNEVVDFIEVKTKLVDIHIK